MGRRAVTLPDGALAPALTGLMAPRARCLPMWTVATIMPYWTYDRHSYNADVLVASSKRGNVLTGGADHH
ncbi:MAG: hypothetical protein ACLSDM_02805 [Butyricicoccus sp.]